MSKWIHKGKPLEELVEGMYGFVYKITFPDNTFYYGSKCFYTKMTKRLSKKKSNELHTGKGRKPKKQKIVNESNWKTYNSSSKIVQERLNAINSQKVKFEVLGLYETKQETLLQEAKLIIESFLNRDFKILNQWVSVKSFKI